MITHNRRIAYLKTDKLVSYESVRNGTITDSFVNRYCFELIETYSKWLNEVNVFDMDVNDIRKFQTLRSKGIL